MRSPLAMICLCALAATVQAQVGPTRARLIHAASKKLPMMLIEQKPRKVVLDVVVGAEGRVLRTIIVRTSGNGVFDERMRGYWKDTWFLPALDAEGKPREDTLRITNTFSVGERSLQVKDFSNHSDIEGSTAAEDAAHIERMKCRDMLWEHDFMKAHSPPKHTLEHEEIYHVAFAMFLAAGNVNETARDALIGEWPKLVERVIAKCREQPDALYWQGVFVPVFTRAAPYQSRPVD